LSILKIQTARIFEPLLKPARYKAAHGGRGSGKSHFFGELLVETCQAERGTLAVCIREAQRTLAQSSKRLIESKIAALGVGSGFKPFSDKIETPGDGIIIFRGMQDDAGKYRLMMKAKDAVASKPVPPVQRPGMARTAAEREHADLRTLNAKLSSSGDIRDAVALYNARKSGKR
jgi:phage terminase large subunit